MNERIVTLIDMDCFYCQVEARLNPELKGKPMAVVQYNAWKGGGIIAVNYEARDRGVTRHMRGDEAKQHCPDIELVSVPSVRGKADLTKYREAGREVVSVLCKFSDCVQRASVDEAYIDLTAAVNKRLDTDNDIQSSQLMNTFVVGYSPEDSNDEDDRANGIETWLDEIYNGDLTEPQLHRLATAAALVEEMRLAVYETTGFRCSAGVAHNKILAKLVCGLHKPNRQSVLPKSSVEKLYQTLPVKKVRNLGGKLGDDVVDRLGITVMADLARFTEKELQNRYDEKTGTWLYNIARGIDLEPVTPRLVSKSIGCCKKFPGRSALATKKDVSHWLAELAAEVVERLEEDFSMNKRRAQLLTVSFQQEISGRTVAMSRSGPITSYEPDKIVATSLSLLNKSNTAPTSSESWTPSIKYLGMSASKFTESGTPFRAMPINNFFKPSDSPVTNNNDKNISEAVTTEKITSNELQTKNQSSNASTSFFERYLRNKSKKLPENEIAKRNCMYFESECEGAESAYASVNDIENKRENNSPENVLENNSSIVDDLSEKPSNSVREGSPETWVSPSEIFPDMSNIDENVLQLLPSPMQRKISAVKKTIEDSENSNDSNDSSNQRCQDSNRFSLMSSTSSDCAPTIIETTAHIHTTETRPSKSNANNSVINYFNRESKTANLNTCFESNSIDIFEEDNVSPPLPTITEECVHCKEQIAIQELPEHLDHHVAMDLHKQLNALPSQVPVTGNQCKAVSSKKKRGRPGKKEVMIPHKKTKTIASFFSKS